MKRSISLILAAALLLTLFSGCGRKVNEPVMAGEGTFGVGEEDSAEVSQAPSARSEGTFSMPFNASYGWNPYNCIGMENQAVMQLVYEGLFTLNNSFEAEPLLCKSYEVSDDGYEYRLELVTAKFSSGKDLSSADVVWSMEQAEESELYGFRLTDVRSVTTDGPTTVVITMSNPNDRLPCLLTFPILPSYSSMDSGPLGTGPFVREGTERLTVNPNWWQGPENLSIRGVTLYSSISAEDTRDNFEIDNVHFVYNNPNATTTATYHSDYELWNSRSTIMQYVGFNRREGVFTNDILRCAVTRAIDRTTIAETVYRNFADAAVLPTHPFSSLYDETLAADYAFTSVRAAREEFLTSPDFYNDPAYRLPGQEEPETEETLTEEEQLLQELLQEEEAAAAAAAAAQEDEEGKEDKKPEKVTYNNIVMMVRTGNLKRVAAARQVAQCLTDVGFTVTIREYEGDSYYYQLATSEWDLFYDEAMIRPDLDLRAILLTDGRLNPTGFESTEELEELFDKALENTGNHYDLFKLIMDQGWMCPVLFINNAVFTTRGVFTGLDPTPSSLFYHIQDVRINRG